MGRLIVARTGVRITDITVRPSETEDLTALAAIEFNPGPFLTLRPEQWYALCLAIKGTDDNRLMIGI